MRIGDIYKIPMDEKDGITPKGGKYRDKLIIILGVDSKNEYVGVVVANSNINLLWDDFNFQYELKHEKYKKGLVKDSYVDCSILYSVDQNRITGKELDTIDLVDYEAIVNKIRKRPDITKRTLKNFNLL